MTKENRPPRTFVEWMLQLLEEQFPVAGEQKQQISGARYRRSVDRPSPGTQDQAQDQSPEWWQSKN